MPETSSLAEAVTWSVKIEFPDLFEASAGTTTTGTLENSESNAFTTSITNQQTQTVTMNAPAGQTCHLEFDSKNCNVQGSGQIQTTATGWVWFNYNDKTQGHYEWAVNLDSVLPNADDRSSYVQFTSSMQGTSTSNFQGSCS